MTLRGALALIDLLIAASVDGPPLAEPPPSPSPGTFYRVASTGASGAFAGHQGALAGYGDGGWRFVAPVEGMRLTERGSGLDLAFRDGAWTSGSIRASEVAIGGVKVVGARGPSIANPVGGNTIDSEARAAVAQILAGLRMHGLIAG